MRVKYGKAGITVIEDDGTEKILPFDGLEIEEPEERVDPRDVNWRLGEEPLTLAQRRTYLETFRRVVEQPREQAFAYYLRQGKDGIPEELRAQAVGTDSAGGFLTPQSFADRFTASLKQYDELFDAATLFETERGTTCGFPVDDDTAAVATIVAENAQSVTTSPVSFDNIGFGRCPQWRSGHIPASMELAWDAAFPLGTVLAEMFGRRMARGVGGAFITNLIADADVGVTAAATGAVTADEILDLVAAVDPAYAVNGAFLLNNTTLTALKKLKASTAGSYLIDIDRDPNTGRTTLFDYPVYISPSLANMGASAKPIAFGNLSRFIRRQVRNSLSVKTYVERYATAGQIAWEAFLRVDGKLAKAANSPLPIRFLQMHA